jgi:uncharacterized protein YjgD (DUF1641 family)
VVEMSEQQPVGEDPPDELTEAIAENPEAVARFVQRLDTVNELLDVVELGEGALDDEMVASLVGTGSTLAEAGDGMATDETVRLAESVGANGDDLADALETLATLQRTGTLDDLVELAQVASLASSALDDEMVASLAGTGSSLGELAHVASEDDTARGMRRLLASVGDVEDAEVEGMGVVGLARSTRDPEVRHGLGYVVTLARALGQRSSEE